jgi:threonylcarbamoyladenosine tRNA methylthiotransferase MtaB
MKRVAFATIGCRLNQYETEKMASKLAACGFSRVDFESPANLYIINTCTVTGRADASCRKSIAHAAKCHGNPKIVVVGCMVTSDRNEVALLNGVDLLISNDEKENIISILQEKIPELFGAPGDNSVIENQNYGGGAAISDFYRHNRAWVKIGDGCNQNCSYCIVPLVRGNLVNRPYDEIIREIRSLVSHDYNEVVLTAVHIGKYHTGDIKSLAQLTRIILSETDLTRLRLSSIEPQEVTNELLDTMASGGSRICRHLHVPLQSGSNRILKDMRRPYNMKQYRAILEMIKAKIDNVVIGADVIVGFPGETDDDFHDTIEIVESGLIDYLHVFSYSNRKGTAASSLSDKVPTAIIKERNRILRDISSRLIHQALLRQVGKVVGAISEHKSERDEYYSGITDNYLKVAIPVGYGGTKQVINIKITGAETKILTGAVVS